MSATPHDVDALARALFHLSALRRDLQRCAGIEHAVAGLAMLSLVRRIGPARVSDVAHGLQVDLSVASRQIHALEQEGHVDRVPDPHDGRSSLIAISDAGLAKLDRANERLTRVIASATADWPSEEIIGLADGLVRLRASLAACDARTVHDHGAAPTSTAPGPAASAGPAGGAGTTRARGTTAPAPGAAASSDPATSALPAAGPAAGPTFTSAQVADARHEEHVR